MSMLEVMNVDKSFGGLNAVRDISFRIEEGEIVGLIGPNGAGKTTLFNVITGFYGPDRGVIRFRGEDVTRVRSPWRLCKKGLARTFQIMKPFRNLSVMENVMVGAFCNVSGAAQAREIADGVLRLTGLAHRRSEPARSLTLADRKRLELARALATRPKLLLLDEVMAGLNPREIGEIILLVRKIREQGVTLFIIEHVMQAMMSLAERIVVMHHGEKIAEGSPAEISRHPEVIRVYLGETG